MKRYSKKKNRFLRLCFVGGLLYSPLCLPGQAIGKNGSAPYVLLQDSVQRDSASATPVPADSSAQSRSPFQGEAIDFNPLDYQMQKRFLPKGRPFRTRHFYDHIFIGAMSGFDQIVPRGGANKDGVPFGLFIGNHFTPLHTLRLSGTYTTWKLPNTSYRMKQAAIDLDYLFDFSSYLNGYDPFRRFSISGLLGFGYMKNSYYSKRHDVFKGQAGLHLDMAIGSNLRLFAEPYVAVSTGEADAYSLSSTLDYDVLYGIRGGLSLYLQGAEGYRHDSIYNGNIFFELSQSANFLMNGNMPFMKTMGTGYQLSMGKWFDSAFGLRATAAVSDYYWSSVTEPATVGSPAYTTRYKGGLFAGRAEVMINPLNFFSAMRNQKHHLFDVNLIGGGEYGWKVNPIEGELAGLRCNYWGGTAALQLLYNADASTSFFIEPRYTHAIYKVPYRNANLKKSYTDQYMLFSAGVRINRPVRAERAEHRFDVFTPYAFVGGSLGANKHMRTLNTEGDASFNALVAVNGGYHLHPFAGFRLQMEYLNTAKNMTTPYVVDFMGMEKRFSALWKRRSGLFQVQLNYLLNLTNIYQGYNQDRKLNIYALFGPGYSVYVNQGGKIYSKELSVGENPRAVYPERIGEGAWNLNGGVLVDYQITPKWTIYADPHVQYFLKENFIGGGSTSRLNDFFIKFSVGCSYQLFP